MPAASYNFSIEQGSDLEVVFQYIDENKAHIEKYRSIMEQKYVTRYFETLVEAHKYN